MRTRQPHIGSMTYAMVVGRFAFQGQSPTQLAAIGAQVAVLSHDDAQQVLDELAGRMDARHVRNPVGYCAKLVERLKRGEFHPVAGLAAAKQRQVNEREQRTMSERETTTRTPVDGTHNRLPERIRSSLERMRPKPPGEQKDEGPKTRS
jgi:hypothetical protein